MSIKPENCTASSFKKKYLQVYHFLLPNTNLYWVPEIPNYLLLTMKAYCPLITKKCETFTGLNTISSAFLGCRYPLSTSIWLNSLLFEDDIVYLLETEY